MTHPTDTEPEKKRKRDPKGTRDRLVRSALDLFTTIGYHESTTPQIATRAGVAEGTIYRHFKSKENLLNSIYQAAVRRFQQTIRSGGTDGTCQTRLTAIAGEWIDIASKDAALVRLVFVRPPHKLLDHASITAYKEFKAELERVLASGKSERHVKPGSVEMWADVWLQLVSLVLKRVSDATWTAEDQATNHVISAAWHAIASTDV
jgi:AcrR family transcriptional regulator